MSSFLTINYDYDDFKATNNIVALAGRVGVTCGEFEIKIILIG